MGHFFFFFFFFNWKVWRFFFFFLTQWVKVFSFPKNSTSLKSKWCIPNGWHVGSYLKGLNQWFSTGGAWPHIYRVTKSYRIIYIIKWYNFDLVLSDIQEIGSQTRKTYKGLELWAMGTLDFFPNQFGGFQMCIPFNKGPPPPCQNLQPLQMNTLLFLHYFVISDILIGMFLLQQT